ncbi:MAG: DUF4416 family protein [Candidatus Zixiibacteriota bacterium]|nr:MAG: DUF4416 family protein [candidate division Zixibacteria bacterium]
MGRVKKPLPGRLIVSVIYASMEAMNDAVVEIEKKYGHVEFETDDIEFLHTTYYREEMGENLKRKFFAFEKMVERDRLAEIKNWTNKLEEKYGEKVGDFVFRKVNIDPGILTPANLTLASTKDYSHRVYLGEGIFAETTLLFEKKRFQTLPWTYPDYAEPEAFEFFNKVRDTMKGKDFEV